MPLILGVVLCLAGAGGGFALTSGMVIPAGKDSAHMGASAGKDASLEVAFVELDPIIVSLGAASDSRHLRFRAQLEVPVQHAAEVAKLAPRVLDVLNGYLRALEVTDIEETAALLRLRSQMLRRVELVLGEDKVNDLLVMEFVLN